MLKIQNLSQIDIFLTKIEIPIFFLNKLLKNETTEIQWSLDHAFIVFLALFLFVLSSILFTIYPITKGAIQVNAILNNLDFISLNF